MTLRQSALLVAIAAMGSTFTAAQTYPHAFPRTGVTKLAENDRVTIWEVNWKIGAKQPVHRHQFDMAGVYLRFGRIVVTSPEGTANPPGEMFSVPRPYFQEKGVTHKEEAVGEPGDPERLAIMVDLKDNVGLPPFQLKEGMLSAFPRDGAKTVLDNARVRMWDYTWDPKKPLAQHVHTNDAIEVYVAGGVIVSKTPDGKEDRRTVAFKDARFVPRGRVDSETVLSGTPRAIVIDLK